VPCFDSPLPAGTRPTPPKVPISVPSFYLRFGVNPRVTKLVTSYYLGLTPPGKQELLPKVRSIYYFGGKPELPLRATFRLSHRVNKLVRPAYLLTLTRPTGRRSTVAPDIKQCVGMVDATRVTERVPSCYTRVTNRMSRKHTHHEFRGDCSYFFVDSSYLF
jgi:hypothetical protein